MPQISSISSQGNSSLNSTMDLVGNQGSTTVRITAQQVVAGAWSTATGDIPYASSASSVSALTIGSSEQIMHVSAGIPAWKDSSAFLSTILTAAGDVLIRSSGGVTRLAGASSAGYFAYSTVDGAIGPKWVTLDPGEIPVQTTVAGGTTSIQVPSSGAVLAYSTANGAIGPTWVVMDAGELLVQTTAAAPTTVVPIASSGGFLAYSTVDGSIGPVWRVGNAGTMYIGAGTTLAAGSSEQILHISGGIPAWKDSSVFLSTIMTVTGDMLIRSSAGIVGLAGASSAAQLSYTTADGSIGPVWKVLDTGGMIHSGATTLAIGSSGQVLQTTGGVPAWVSLASGELFTGNSSGEIVALGPGTSGQVLQTTGGVLSWETDETGAGLPSTAGITSGAIIRQNAANTGQEWLEAGTSGQILETTGGLPAWKDQEDINTYGVALSNATTLTLTSGVGYTALTWDFTRFDNGGLHSTAANSSLVTIPAGSSGIYQINAGANYAAGTSETALRITAAGVDYTNYNQGLSTNSERVVTMSILAQLNAADTITVKLFNPISSALTVLASLPSWFHVQRIGPHS